MSKIPDKVKQIAIVHAQLINAVVMTCQNSALMQHLEPELKKAELNGWTGLVKRIRKILKGSRKSNLMIGLDEEDAAIILSILVGIQNPAELPHLNKQEQSAHAPQTLAKLIDSSLKGDMQAKTLLASMQSQMLLTPGDMGLFAKVIDQLSEGHFDISKIRLEMSEEGKKLSDALVDELAKLNSN